MNCVNGKVALVTGGSGVIGLAMITELLKNGAKGVSIVDISEETGHKAVEEIVKSFGQGKAIFIKTDITIENELEEAFEVTVKTFNQLDIVINNAGIVNEGDWKRSIAVNLTAVIEGTYLAMKKYLPKYRTEEEGVIINTSSVAGLIADQSIPVYCTAKNGLIGFGKSLGGKELYKIYKVRVLTLCPYFVDSSIFKFEENDDRLMLPHLATNIFKQGCKYGQRPESVGKALIEVIKNGKSGSVWVQEFDKPVYEIKIPHYSTMKVLKD